MRMSVQILPCAIIAALFLGPCASMAGAVPTPPHGRILDQSDQPIPFARIVAAYADGSIEEVRADKSGNFNLEPKGNLPVRLEVYAPGYTAAQRELVDWGT